LKTGTKLSGSYSVNDEIGNKREDYSFSNFAVELVIRASNSGGEQQGDLQNIQIYTSINGSYSLNTTPDVDCIEGVFSFKTIKPIKSGGEGEGYCGIESGEIEVNNAKIEFSSGKVKVSVENQQKEYGCEEVEGLCKYEPIEIPQIEIIEEGGEEIGACPEGNVCAPASTFAKTIGRSSYDEVAYSIIQSSDGGYAVAGSTRSFGAGYYDMYVVKLDSGGNVQWAKTIGGSGDDGAYSIIQSSDGGYVVAGFTKSFGAGGSDMYVVKLDSGGNVQWAKTIGGSGDDGAYSIIQSSDGGYAVAGSTRSFGAGYYDMYVVKLDSGGNVQWAKTIDGNGDDGAYSIIQSSDGGYAVAGFTSRLVAGYYDMYVVKLDSGGNVQWAKTIGGSDWDQAGSIIQSSDGGYAVAGFTSNFGAGGDMYVVKLDSEGNVQWTKTIGGINYDQAYSIIRSSDGGYAVAGFTSSFGAGYYDMYVVKMDANGNVCFSQNITNYSVSSNVGSSYSPSVVAISQSPTVKSVSTISPTISSGGSVKDVCALAKAPHFICSGSQDCGFRSAVATNGENVKSYGHSAGGVLSRFIIPASMLIFYGQLRKKRKKKKVF
jgi:hypothetical protein